MRRSMASSRRTMRNCTRGPPRVGYPSDGGRTPRRLARIRRRTHASVSRTCSAARRRYQAEIGSCWPRVRPSCSAKRTAVRGTRNFNRSFKHSSLEPRLVVQEPDTSPRSLFTHARHTTVHSLSLVITQSQACQPFQRRITIAHAAAPETKATAVSAPSAPLESGGGGTACM